MGRQQEERKYIPEIHSPYPCSFSTKKTSTGINHFFNCFSSYPSRWKRIFLLKNYGEGCVGSHTSHAVPLLDSQSPLVFPSGLSPRHPVYFPSTPRDKQDTSSQPQILSDWQPRQLISAVEITLQKAQRHRIGKKTPQNNKAFRMITSACLGCTTLLAQHGLSPPRPQS